MSFPRQINPQQHRALQDEAARRMIDDASQQLASGNPAKSLQTVLNLLSALHLPEEAAAAAIKVQEAMAQDPSRDISAQLASLLGSLNLVSTREQPESSRGFPLPPLPTQMIPTSLQSQFNNLHHQDNSEDIEMEQMDVSESIPRGNEAMLSQIRQGTAVAVASDGESSYVCARCNSVISVARKAAHDETWCPALQKHLPT